MKEKTRKKENTTKGLILGIPWRHNKENVWKVIFKEMMPESLP